MNEDSPFHLKAPDSAAGICMVSILLEHGTPTISVVIGGMLGSLILDTGSNILILQPSVSRGYV